MNASSKERSRFSRRIAGPFIAGLLAILPLGLTVAVTIWMADLVHRSLGPTSALGKLSRSFGLQFVTGEIAAYLIGITVSLAGIYVLGVIVEAGMKNRWHALLDRMVSRLPVVRTVYDASKKLMGMFEKKDQAELKAMRPVVCHFGGKGGTAVLALMPSPQPIQMHGIDYCGVLIPTAPVPFGGALLYVPADWIEPTDFAFDGLFNIYMSMGVTAPDYFQKLGVSSEEGHR